MSDQAIGSGTPEVISSKGEQTNSTRTIREAIREICQALQVVGKITPDALISNGPSTLMRDVVDLLNPDTKGFLLLLTEHRNEPADSLDANNAPDVQENAIDRIVKDLSSREIEILAHLRKGLSNKLIARKLGIAEATVKAHVKGLLRKLQLENRTQVAIMAVRLEVTGRAIVKQDLGGLENKHATDLDDNGVRDARENAIDRKEMQLSSRETEILAGICVGKSNKSIARELDIAEATVKAHVKGLLRKMGAVNRTQAAVLIEEKKWGTPELWEAVRQPLPPARTQQSGPAVSAPSPAK